MASNDVTRIEATYGSRRVELIEAVTETSGPNETAMILRTNRGDVPVRLHPAPAGKAGVVWVGGAGGGLDGPARGLYPAACERLQALGVAGLRLHYRHPNDLENCALDTLLGVKYLLQQGCERIALVGHSFGGAVVISAGANSRHVKAVVPMSTQTYGTDATPRLAPRALLLIHGTADRVLPDSCSRQVFRIAREPKELKLFPGAGHGLDGAREEILEMLVRWLTKRLDVSGAPRP